MNRTELYRAAHATVQRRRQQAEVIAERRRAEAYEAVPALARLDSEKNLAGAAAARYAADGQRELAEQKLQEAKAANAARAVLLGELGLAEADLLPRYTCALCGDTGRQGGAVCACVHDEVKKLRRAEITENGPLTLCRFESFRLDCYPEKMDGVQGSPRSMMRNILRYCLDYAAEFGPASESLLLYGDAGLGKTHIALSIAAQVLDAGYDVIYVSAQSAFRQMAEERWDGDGLFKTMYEAQLLVLDDLGTEFVDSYVQSRLYELINGRMRRPTIYTTNITGGNSEELRSRLEMRYTEKISSRLLGECHPVRFLGYDLRLRRRF